VRPAEAKRHADTNHRNGRRKEIMLQVDHLSKIFTLHLLGGKRIRGVEDVNFRVGAGETLVLRAPSGEGKSSILKCIYRTYRPTAGRILFQSSEMGVVDLADLDDHRIIRLRNTEIGYVTQFLKVLPRVSSIDIVAEPLVENGVAPAAARETARKYLQRLRIPDRLFEAYPGTFSGGEQQRVNIARAVIRRPRLLLLDEPTASLDPDSTATVLEMLADLKNTGTAIVAVFHDQRVAGRIADHVYQLRPKDSEPCMLNRVPNTASVPMACSSKMPLS
jgi:alpha-D-ribose 1-methylphosphonate 5-triphosphate synthase subunit PhnL